MFASLPDIPTTELLLPEAKEAGVRLFIRREDLNHPLVSGNKLRKIKYNVLEARKLGHSTLLTFGGAYSNHILATAAAGKEMGFRTIGVIRGEEPETMNPTLVDARRLGMHLHYISRSGYREKSDPGFQRELEKQFGNFFMIPEGGTNTLALQGVGEMVDWKPGTYDYVCCPVGTGGTVAGLIAGSENESAIGFSSLKNAFSLEKDIAQLVHGKKGWNLNHDYHFGGYAKTNPELIQFIHEFYRTWQIPLEPIYTGKMMWGIRDLIKKGYFKPGSRILAIHTGGLQGNRGFGIEF
jgi:1-aminocyclopropane-1-carboxylate deaminase/D-cysteine desulfhydrase-like pyridoxal-dependent ACC family enzyme